MIGQVFLLISSHFLPFFLIFMHILHIFFPLILTNKGYIIDFVYDSLLS